MNGFWLPVIETLSHCGRMSSDYQWQRPCVLGDEWVLTTGDRNSVSLWTNEFWLPMKKLCVTLNEWVLTTNDRNSESLRSNAFWLAMIEPLFHCVHLPGPTPVPQTAIPGVVEDLVRAVSRLQCPALSLLVTSPSSPSAPPLKQVRPGSRSSVLDQWWETFPPN